MNRFGWDGRAASLEEQSLLPVANPAEMASTTSRMVATLSGIAGYARYFQRAFGDRAITRWRVASALADYQRTRLSGNSAWDRWHQGDAHALSPSARRGRDLFTGDARCSHCHFGPNLTDGAFHNLGLGWDPASERYTDEGRGVITGERATGAPSRRLHARRRPPPAVHARRVVTNLARRRPVLQTGWRPESPPRYADSSSSPFHGDIDALVDFLGALNGEGFMDRAPTDFPK